MFAGYSQLHLAALRDGALERKVVELLLCAVNAAEYQFDVRRGPRGCGAGRPARQRQSSSGAIATVIPVAGVAAWAAAAGALAAT